MKKIKLDYLRIVFQNNTQGEFFMKKTITVLLVCLILTSFLFAQPAKEEKENTRIFIDSCNREVEIPNVVNAVVPSGNVATIFLTCFAPEKMVSVNAHPSQDSQQYFSSILSTLPETGQLYGGKSTLNLEEILSTGAEVIIDLGDYKKGMEEDLNTLQETVGIPVIFIASDLENMASAFRSLGEILNMEERGEELARLVEETLSMAKENSSKIKDEERVSVMYTSSPSGLGTNAKGSSQAQVLDIIGAENAVVVDNVSGKGGGNIINLEQLLIFNPDIIVFTPDSLYESVENEDGWKELDAIKNGKYYEVPDSPYNWLSMPPSMNMILGIWWLGNLVYPEYYNYDMATKAQEIYSLFWNYKLSSEEINLMLSRSTLK